MKDAATHLLASLGLAFRGVLRRPLSSALTLIAVALGVGLVVLVDSVRASTETSFRDAVGGYDVLLAPPHGSPLQATLSTLFHVDEPGGTLAWSVYEEALADERVKDAIPYAMGDTYRGHRVIGTTDDLFTLLTDGERRPIGEGVRGRLFRTGTFEAVVGSGVARATGLALGQDFGVTHGLAEGGHAHDERWTVVGVLRPTGTPHDRAIYIPIQTFYAIPGHDAAAPEEHTDCDDPDHEHDHANEELDLVGIEGLDDDDHAECDHDGPQSLSAIGIRLKSPQLRLGYFHEFRTTRTNAQAVLPADQVRKLLGIVGDVNRAVGAIAWLVTVVAGLGILVGLYNTIHGRRREIALLRALGARPLHVFSVILFESLLLCLAGGVLGLVLGHGVAALAAPTALASYGVRLDPSPGAMDATILLALIGLGVLAGLLPAWRGLTTPVAENLEPDA